MHDIDGLETRAPPHYNITKLMHVYVSAIVVWASTVNNAIVLVHHCGNVVEVSTSVMCALDIKTVSVATYCMHVMDTFCAGLSLSNNISHYYR